MSEHGGEPVLGRLIADADLLAELRALMPHRPINRDEAQSVAERQATRLLALWFIEEPPVPQFVISSLPGVFVDRRRRWPTAGMSFQAHRHWRIVLNADEPSQRQRYTLAHELKHILDDPAIDHIHAHLRRGHRNDLAEESCDYFAACLLMPRVWVKRDWSTGQQNISHLAWRYHVSQQAMSRRLHDLGLIKSEAPTTDFPSDPVRGRRRRRRGTPT